MLERVPIPVAAPGWFPPFAAWLDNALRRLWDDSRRVVTVTASQSLGDGQHMVLVDASAGAVTVALPDAASFKGQEYHIKKIDSSGNAVTIAAADTIDGAASLSFSVQWTTYSVFCNGSGWFVK